MRHELGSSAAWVNSLSKKACSTYDRLETQPARRAHTSLAHSPALVTIPIRATIKGVSAPGRSLLANARKNSSEPDTLKTSAGCGNTFPFKVRPSLAAL